MTPPEGTGFDQPATDDDASAATLAGIESNAAAATDEQAETDVEAPETGQGQPETGEDTGGELDFGPAPPEGTPERQQWDGWTAKLTQLNQALRARERELDQRTAESGGEAEELTPEELYEAWSASHGTAAREQQLSPEQRQAQEAQAIEQMMSTAGMPMPYDEMTPDAQALARLILSDRQERAAQSYNEMNQQLEQKWFQLHEANPSLRRDEMMATMGDLMRQFGHQAVRPEMMDYAAYLIQNRNAAAQREQAGRQRQVEAQTVRRQTATRTRATGTEASVRQQPTGGKSMVECYVDDCLRRGVEPDLS